MIHSVTCVRYVCEVSRAICDMCDTETGGCAGGRTEKAGKRRKEKTVIIIRITFI